MLALSRKKNEAIVINNDIEITVLEVKGDQVKIGITAPKEVPIYRKEVYLQIQEANRPLKTRELRMPTSRQDCMISLILRMILNINY